MPDAIVLRGLTKTFGDTVAVRDLDLVVPAGRALRRHRPQRRRQDDDDPDDPVDPVPGPRRAHACSAGASALEAKDRIGYLPEERGLYKKMRVGEFLVYMARLKGVDGAGPAARVRRWLERVDLGRRARRSGARSCRRACSRRCSSSRRSSTSPTC